MENTIVALSTARGRSAIAVVRMSGEKSIEIAKKIFSPFPEKPNYLKVGTLKTKDFNEQAMCVYFVAPRSYTGENSVEFHCHGGSAVPKAVIEACLDKGAVMAQNGEFSKRAFINGKQNLTNAEGIIEMIDAETASAAKAGANLTENKLGKQITELQNRLLDLLSSTEAALDYPEEDLELPTLAQVKSQISDILSVLEGLIATSALGKVAKWGIDVAIVGAPNVGKSSLLNALLGENRAIVSEIQGTTRDTLCESILYKDIKINFIDTAGIRETTDKIEEEGIRRAEAAAEKADVVLYLVDSPTDKSTYKTEKPLIKVFNKADLYTAPQTKDGEIAISAKYGDTEVIKELLYKMFNADEIQTSDLLITNERHLSCLKQAYELLKSTTKAENATLDIVSTAMRQTWEKLGEITGSTASEDIINNIYSKFCLGK